MSPATTGTVYLITGASRGIGLAMAREVASRSTSADPFTIIAAVRTPSNAPLLDEVRKEFPGVTIDVVSYVSADVENNKKLAEYLKEKYGRVDVVVANAGIANFMGPISKTPLSQLRDHWEVNTLGPIILFQALVDLLKASSNPKFVPITSGFGSSAYSDAPFGQGAYGGSKTALNFVTKRIHVEEDWITAFPLAPGVVMTDMAKASVGYDAPAEMKKMLVELAQSPEAAARLLVDIVAQATRKTHGGEYYNVDGKKLPW